MGSWWFYPTENNNLTECDNDIDTIEKQSPVQEEDQHQIEPISSRTSTPNRSRMKLLNDSDDVLTDKSCNNDREYSASAASSGSGFHGETAILGKTFQDDTDLPIDANQIIDLIQKYLENVKLNENVMNLLSVSDKKFMNDVWDVKLKNNLNNLIIENNMSRHAYDTLTNILNALKSNDYDAANKNIAKITRNKREFVANKKWIIAFKSVVRIAKQYNI